MVRSTTGFEGNHGGREPAQEGDQILARQLCAGLAPRRHSPRELEDVFDVSMPMRIIWSMDGLLF